MAALAGKVGAIEKRLDGINFAHEEASSAAAQQAALAGYAAKLRRQRWVSLRHPRRGRLTRHKKGGFRRKNLGIAPRASHPLSHARLVRNLAGRSSRRCSASKPCSDASKAAPRPLAALVPRSC